MTRAASRKGNESFCCPRAWSHGHMTPPASEWDSIPGVVLIRKLSRAWAAEVNGGSTTCCPRAYPSVQGSPRVRLTQSASSSFHRQTNLSSVAQSPQPQSHCQTLRGQGLQAKRVTPSGMKSRLRDQLWQSRAKAGPLFGQGEPFTTPQWLRIIKRDLTHSGF